MTDTCIIVDAVPREEGHSRGYNRSFLEVAAASEGWSRIVYLSSPTICEMFSRNQWAPNIEFVPRCRRVDFENQSKLSVTVRLFYNYAQGMLAAARTGGILVFTHVEALSFGLILTCLPRRWLNNHRVTFVDQLPNYARKRLLHRLLLQVVFRRVYGVIVFEEAFRESVDVGGRGRHPRVTVMHHPFRWDLVDEAEAPPRLGYPRRIHSVGSLRPEKGMKLFPEALARAAEDDGCGSRFEVGVFGQIPAEVSRELPSGHRGIRVENRFLGEREYVRRFQDAHFILVAHTRDFYPKVSGVLMDALAMDRPLVASDIDLVRYYFHRYGSMGILFRAEDASDMARAILQASRVTEDEYSGWCENIQKFRRARSSRELQRQLKEAMAV